MFSMFMTEKDSPPTTIKLVFGILMIHSAYIPSGLGNY